MVEANKCISFQALYEYTVNYDKSAEVSCDACHLTKQSVVGLIESFLKNLHRFPQRRNIVLLTLRNYA